VFHFSYSLRFSQKYFFASTHKQIAENVIFSAFSQKKPKFYTSFAILPLVLLLSLPLMAQKATYSPEKLFSAEQIAKDIDVVQEVLYKFHPDIFHYTPKDTLDKLFFNLKTQFTAANERQIRIALRKIVARIGCGHTNIIPSQKFISYYTKYEPYHLPLDVIKIDDKLFITNDLTIEKQIPKGSELLSVNGVNAIELAKEIEIMEGSDGFNHTHQHNEISHNYRYFCSLLLGNNECYEVKTQDSLRQIRSYELIDNQEDTIIKKTKNNSLKSQQSSLWLMQQPYKKLRIDTTNNLAIFKLEEFEGKSYKKFYKQLFKNLHEQEVKNLVIDLRNNGGGKMFDACELLTYLVDKPFSYEFKRKKQPNTFKKYMVAGKTWLNFVPLMFRIVAKKKVQNDSIIYTINHTPKKDYFFKEKVYVLTNGGTFSAASFVAAYLQQLSKATIIGEETGGSVVGTNAMLFTFIKLPETEINLRMPLYRVNHLLHFDNQLDKKQGVMPNKKLTYTLTEVLEHKDKEMELVNELIKEK
jgi:uncharacterized membrane protein (DUF485 family)